MSGICCIMDVNDKRLRRVFAIGAYVSLSLWCVCACVCVCV